MFRYQKQSEKKSAKKSSQEIRLKIVGRIVAKIVGKIVGKIVASFVGTKNRNRRHLKKSSCQNPLPLLPTRGHRGLGLGRTMRAESVPGEGDGFGREVEGVLEDGGGKGGDGSWMVDR